MDIPPPPREEKSITFLLLIRTDKPNKILSHSSLVNCNLACKGRKLISLRLNTWTDVGATVSKEEYANWS